MLNNKKNIYIPTSFNLKILGKTKLNNTTKLKNFIIIYKALGFYWNPRNVPLSLFLQVLPMKRLISTLWVYHKTMTSLAVKSNKQYNIWKQHKKPIIIGK